MTANTTPIYSAAPSVQIGSGGAGTSLGAIIGPSANTATDGTGANMYEIFQADATNGGRVERIILKPIGTVAATVARVFLCQSTGAFTAGTTNTAANTALLTEMQLAAWTASNTAASPQYEIPINMAMEPGTSLLMSFGTSTGAAGNGYNPITIGGKY